MRLEPEAPVEDWCAERDIQEAVSGGYAVKPRARAARRALDQRPPSAASTVRAHPWSARRAALFVVDGRIDIEYRDRLPERSSGDLLQAGPLLVTKGVVRIADVTDPEGFSATAEEFDEDITAQREPRLAVAVARGVLLVVAADGRGDEDAGLSLWEFADVLVDLGAHSAMNLDAGSAGVIVSGGRRINTPRDNHGADMDLSSPSVTAIVITAR